jgi:probable F420-dependent oxidoreductase
MPIAHRDDITVTERHSEALGLGLALTKSGVRFGAILPVPGTASPAEVLAFAAATEDLGYDSVWMNSHVVRPVEMEDRHPYTPDGKPPWAPTINWPDAFVVFSFIAAHTQRLRFGPAVVPLITTHPLILAKQAATLDAYSGGRLELGLGAGWLLEEAEALGHPTDHRSARLREAIDILRLAWSRDTFSYAGRHWVIPEVGLHPHPAQGEKIPLWIGGHGKRALEIAADASCGVFLWGGYSPAQVAEYAGRVRAINPFVAVATLVSLTANEGRWGQVVSELQGAGADLLVVSGRFTNAGERLDAVRRFGEAIVAGANVG